MITPIKVHISYNWVHLLKDLEQGSLTLQLQFQPKMDGCRWCSIEAGDLYGVCDCDRGSAKPIL